MSSLPYHWKSIHPDAAVHYVSDLADADSLVDRLSSPVGFDLEWKPTFKKGTPENPVAIVQLANERIILVIQVSAMKQFPMRLKQFLENPDIVKAGVAIQNDAKKLFKDWQVSAHNCVDLSLLARCADNARWKGKYNASLGLARLVEAYESRVLPKGKITRGNWEAQLTPLQVDYAANDAHAGFVLYQRLFAMANAMSKVPKPVYYSFSIVRGSLCEPSGMHWNCHNPDYDPGPPPPPKPPKPPTARDVQRVHGTAGAAPKSDFLPLKSLEVSTSPSQVFNQFKLPYQGGLIHQRNNPLPKSNSGEQDSSPSATNKSSITRN